MKEYIFLYPIKAYIDSLIEMTRLNRNRDGLKKIQHLNEIISARYRQKGFNINWLTYDPNPHSPKTAPYTDLAWISEYVTLAPQDRFLGAGITFADSIQHNYPDPQHILDQLPQSASEIVLGGFHQWDCVDKLAAYLYQAGMKVVVDEDTTEKFFYNAAMKTKVPLLRTKFTMSALGITGIYAELSRKQRAGKPWFIQK